VQLADVAALTSVEGRRLLDQLPPYDDASALSVGEQLRRQGHPAPLVAAALTQSRLRTKAGRRWGAEGAELLGRLLLTPDGAEQATRPTVAALRAQRFERVGPDASVADFGCGVGLDALALADAGLTVDAYDRDPLTVAVARANATARPGERSIRVMEADVTTVADDVIARYDAIFADPARRQNGRRLLKPEQWSPPLSWVLALPTHHLGVKVAPGLDRERVPTDMEFAVVSDRGDVVEASLYRGATRDDTVRRSATLLPAGARLTDRDLPATVPPVAAVDHYLHEPDGAAIRAGLVAAVAAHLDGWLLDPQIAYICTSKAVSSPWVTSYEVLDVLPFQLKRLRAYLRARDVGQVVVKKRGSAVDVDELRRSLRLDRAGAERRTLVLTRVGADPIVAVCHPTVRR
jgi:SAM-dependent methyltransferase